MENHYIIPAAWCEKHRRIDVARGRNDLGFLEDFLWKLRKATFISNGSCLPIVTLAEFIVFVSVAPFLSLQYMIWYDSKLNTVDLRYWMF